MAEAGDCPLARPPASPAPIRGSGRAEPDPTATYTAPTAIILLPFLLNKEGEMVQEVVDIPTYSEVAKGIQERFSAGTASVYISHLRSFMRDMGVGDDDPAAALMELTEAQLHQWAAGRPDNARSAIRRAQEVAKELHRLRLLRASLPSDLPSRLRFLMQQKGIGVKRLARASGVASSTIWRILTGSTPSDPPVLRRLEEALDAPGLLWEVARPAAGQRLGGLPKRILGLARPFTEGLREGERKRFYRILRSIVAARGLSFSSPDEALEKAIKEAMEMARREPPPDPYSLSATAGEWPEPLRSEWEAYRRFSTDLARGTVESAFMQELVFPKKPVREATLERERQTLDLFFGYVRARGVSPLTLRLVVTQPELVRDYLAWQEARKGRVTESEGLFLNFLLKILNPGRGFLLQAPRLAPSLFPPEDGWQERVRQAREWLKGAARRLRIESDPGFGNAEPLTRLERPLEPLIQAEGRLRAALEELVGDLVQPRFDGLFPRYVEVALHMYHDLVAFGLLLRTALRAKHVYMAKRDNLRIVEGRVYLAYPKEFFKNSDSSFFRHVPQGEWIRRMAVEGSELPPIAPLVRTYLTEILPRLRRGEDLLFPLFRGNKDFLDRRWRAFLERYLCPYPVRVPVIPGSAETEEVVVKPFGVHAVRHLTATHALKVSGNPSLAAYLLMDTLDTVVKHYARFIPDEMVERAAAAVFGGGAPIWRGDRA